VEPNIIFVGPSCSVTNHVIKKISGVQQLKRGKQQSSGNMVLLSHFFEYSTIKINEKTSIRLINCKSYELANLLEKSWSKNLMGMVVLLNSNIAAIEDQLETIVKYYPPSFFTQGLSIGIIETKNSSGHLREKIIKKVDDLNLKAAVFDVDITNHESLSLLVQSSITSSLYCA